MLSRMAEGLYWIGRYVERAEDTARITDVTYHHTLGMGESDEAEAHRRRHWETLIAIVGDASRFAAEHEVADEDTVPHFLAFAANNPNSIVSCVARARENARAMRHRIASEMWEVLNRFHLELQEFRAQGPTAIRRENAHLFYRSVKEFSHLFQGVTDSTMPREEEWYFLQVGKFLERAEKTARTLDAQYQLLVPEAADESLAAGTNQAEALIGDAATASGEWSQWIAVLRSLSAYEAYHKLSWSAVRPTSVVELMVLAPTFPRSIRFAISEVDMALRRIAASRTIGDGKLHGEVIPVFNTGPAGVREAERSIGRLRSQLEYQRIDEMLAAGLHVYLVDLQRWCYRIGEEIQAEYFAHRPLRAEEVVV